MDEIDKYRERLHIALNAARICIFEVDLVRQLYTFFENAEVIFGVSGDTILRDVRPYSSLEPNEYRLAVSQYFSHPDDEEVINDAFKCILRGETVTYEARMRAAGSGFVWCSICVTPILEGGRPVRMIGVITDITDIKEKTDTLKHAVSLDSFTGLYNKEHAIDSINNILCKDRQLKHVLAVIDIDNFKNFNDTYGHDEGDKIIKGISENIKNMFGKTDIVGRFGGDEFIVFIRDFNNYEWLCDKLSSLLSFRVGKFSCTNSIGVSFFPQDAEDFSDLFKKADMALYHAKIKKERFVFFSDIERL
ncbi:sensor domain-containing diguanylate cyclase [Lachnospiraceae bacterium NSJ-143]|nr:sensor domain-containing diguanylate cyclase [Lachnospiraceae bacterium NSJ-143]